MPVHLDKMVRSIGKILALLLLLLALAIVVLWIRIHSKSIEMGIYDQKQPNPQHYLIKDLRLFIAENHAWIFLENEDIDLTRDTFNTQNIVAGKMKPGWGCYAHQTPIYPSLFPGKPSYPLPAGTFEGFHFSSGPNNFLPPTYVGRWITGHQTTIILPLWFPILLFSIPAIVHFRHSLKRTLRLRRGLCPTCGYDLRESKETCPECGAKQRPAVSTVTDSPLAKNLRG